jgi:transcription elongation factor GreA-like protein
MCRIEPYNCLCELKNARTLLSDLYDATEVVRRVFVWIIQRVIVVEQSISQIDEYSAVRRQLESCVHSGL